MKKSNSKKISSSHRLVFGEKFPMTVKFAVILFCLPLLSLLFFSSSVYAQLSVDVIGMDTSQNETYQCVRYTDVSLNTISVINANDEEMFLSIEKAKGRIKKSIKRAVTRRNGLKKKLMRLKDELSSISTKIFPRPNTSKKIKRLKKAIKDTKRAISIVNGQRKNLVQLNKQVVLCGKEEALTGGLGIQTITFPSILFDGEFTQYLISVFYNFVRPVQIGEAYCVKLANFPGVKRMPITVNPCAVRNADNSCSQHFTYSGFVIGGVSGVDFAGANALSACAAGDPEYRCDIGKAQAEAARIAAEADPVVLGKAESGLRGCERFE